MKHRVLRKYPTVLDRNRSREKEAIAALESMIEAAQMHIGELKDGSYMRGGNVTPFTKLNCIIGWASRAVNDPAY